MITLSFLDQYANGQDRDAAAQFQLTSNYSASATEDEWLSSPKRGHICETAALVHQLEAARSWLSYSTSVFRPNKQPAPPPDEQQRSSLSFMHKGGSAEPIEPLHGIGRHPFAHVGCFYSRRKVRAQKREDRVSLRSSTGVPKVPLFDLTYLIIKNNCKAR